MAFNQQENEIIQWGLQNGKTKEETQQALIRFRTTGSPADLSKQTEPELSTAQKAGSLAVGAGKGFIEGAIETTALLQKGGQAFLAAIDPTKTFDEIRESTGFKSLDDEGVKELLRSKNEFERTGKIVGFAAEVLAGGGAGLIRRGVTRGGRALQGRFGKVSQVGEDIIEKAAETRVISGGIQKGKELFERVPRFFGRAKEATEEAAIRAERIKISTPAVQTAIKSGLDERIINTVQQADSVTVKDFREIFDIAESATGKQGGTLKLKQRPEIVAGRSASEQFALIEKKKKDVGKQIGVAVDKLSKTEVLSLSDEITALTDVLVENGGTLTKRGWVFKGKITKAEAGKINELWSEVQKTVEGLTPRQVRDFDQLFSKLQRETRLEGIGDIRVDTPQGNMSLFRVFRDVFSNKLDELSPEIRVLNKEFRKFVTLQDDIESSIIKSGNFEVTKGVDAAEFAQINLRRITSDAASAADYRIILSEMDKVARELGYVGSNPEDLIIFATEMRKLFPEVIPPTSFTGGIKTGVLDIAKDVLKAGTPDITDQQKALKQLLESLLE